VGTDIVPPSPGGAGMAGRGPASGPRFTPKLEHHDWERKPAGRNPNDNELEPKSREIHSPAVHAGRNFRPGHKRVVNLWGTIKRRAMFRFRSTTVSVVRTQGTTETVVLRMARKLRRDQTPGLLIRRRSTRIMYEWIDLSVPSSGRRSRRCGQFLATAGGLIAKVVRATLAIWQSGPPRMTERPSEGRRERTRTGCRGEGV
jgi:hypothetical protein